MDPPAGRGGDILSGAAGRAAAKALRATTEGEVAVPGDARYDALRLPWNRRLDPRPAVVFRPHSAAEVPTAVAVARTHGLPLAPQSTGHGTELPCDGGLLLLTGGLSEITVRPERHSVRVGPGVRMAQVVAAARPHGLTPVAGSGEVGVTGFVLGGGIGWLSRAHGLAADGLLAADLVTSTADTLTASPDEHPDLHWALRGGGGNFGVLTALELRLHPVVDGYGGFAVYDLRHAAGILRRYRELVSAFDETATVGVVLYRQPATPAVPEELRGRPVVAVRGLFLTSDAAARRQLRPLLAEAGRPLLGGFRRLPVAALGVGTTPPTARLQHVDLFRALPDPVLDALVAWAQARSGVVEIRLWGGAIARPPVPPGPAGHRDTRFSVLVEAPVGAAGELAALAGRLAPHATGGTFLNFLSDPGRTRTAFTPAHYDRLVEVKRRHDPENVFHLNHNIPPEGDGVG
ncbi:FAD-binding oxidoreductase [Streptomyces sp. DSM 44915]|uniref:FAD-binding oxidoreductase n=1 Tax=Streptomyces chisholmiae TaxID=3075540 RepID=A0ABU2JNE6_9ACTN|nr:FAD-binding oxidoreductase [Streptomyces sp. DSM 44915]MDT0266504.1 FAD-binding oxidoreductase [Streptomyces sp. DSM 44915]